MRSVGYSDVFCLAKADLWRALEDYPEARRNLLDRGCQLLRKDGLLDEDELKKAEAENESLRDKVLRLGESRCLLITIPSFLSLSLVIIITCGAN